MATFARIDSDNIVVNVVEVEDGLASTERSAVEFLQGLLGVDTVWKQTFADGSLRKNYAGIGYTYDATLDAFVPPRPFPSWTLDANTAQWVPPIPMPVGFGMVVWNESGQSWTVFAPAATTTTTPAP